MRQRLLRWTARWLESRGLGAVSDALDRRSAEAGDVESLHDMARRSLGRNDPESAIRLLHQALTELPNDARLYCSLGAAYRQTGQLDDSRTAYERALALQPDYLQVLSNLGEWCIVKGCNDEALEWFDKALAIDSAFFEARLNKTAALFELARFDEARTISEKLLVDEPFRAEAHINLGNLLVHTGKTKQGIKHYRKALELQPGCPEAHFNLGALLGSKTDLANTIGYLERRLTTGGESVHNLCMLAAAHQAAGHLGKAEQISRRILQRQPNNITALITLGSCLGTSGNSAEAVKLYEQVVEIDPSQAVMGSNVLFEYNNLAEMGRNDLFKLHLEWAQQHAVAQENAQAFTEHDRTPRRKLRIGYISGDFVAHPVGFLLRDILSNHDSEKFEIHCFSMVIRSEDVLPELRNAAQTWEEIFFLTDDEVVNLIRKAKIDILVDLSGHTASHRLLAFASRPAPVQVEWIGYFHSTGMAAIDYFITDRHTSPPDGGQLFAETPLFLPHSRFCYGPPTYAPEVGPVPSVQKGFVTFGSFNRLPKLTDQAIAAWSAILLAVPRSRMIIKSSAFSETVVVERLLARFAHHHVAPDRLVLREGSPHLEMLHEYGEVDIALDTFPFNGGMTTLEALWMGVPVAALAGDTVVSRQSYSALANLGLTDELVFSNVDAYVAGAIALAQNPKRLAELRRELRPRMEASPLRQSKQFTKDLEDLYRRMWVAWCEGRKLDSDVEGCPVQAMTN
jgi:protein O-GlcNAc transferase